MKLYYSRNSPYARIARIAVIESGLQDRVEHIEVENRSPDSPLLRHSPVCRVPTLVHGGLVLGEARNICGYLDDIAGTSRLVPRSSTDWGDRGFESMVVGFLGGIACWVRENRREPGERSAFLLDVERRRAERCLDHFEAEIASRSRQAWDFSGIALACALGVMEFHVLAGDWRAGRPALAEWFHAHRERPSMLATRPA